MHIAPHIAPHRLQKNNCVVWVKEECRNCAPYGSGCRTGSSTSAENMCWEQASKVMYGTVICCMYGIGSTPWALRQWHSCFEPWPCACDAFGGSTGRTRLQQSGPGAPLPGNPLPRGSTASSHWLAGTAASGVRHQLGTRCHLEADLQPQHRHGLDASADTM